MISLAVTDTRCNLINPDDPTQVCNLPDGHPGDDHRMRSTSKNRRGHYLPRIVSWARS